MRAARPVLALGLVAALSAVGVADAATKPKPKPVPPVCKLLVDAKADAQFLGEAPNDPSLDIISADIASDASKVTGVLRLDKYAAVSPTSPLGRGYYVLFNLPKSTFPIYLNVQVTPDVTRYAWGTLETLATGNGSYVRKGDATGVIDTAKNELRITVPLSAIKTVASMAPGTKVSSINASTTSVFGTSASGGLVSRIDEASTSKSYTAGAKSCVVPGK